MFSPSALSTPPTRRLRVKKQVCYAPPTYHWEFVPSTSSSSSPSPSSSTARSAAPSPSSLQSSSEITSSETEGMPDSDSDAPILAPRSSKPSNKATRKRTREAEAQSEPEFDYEKPQKKKKSVQKSKTPRKAKKPSYEDEEDFECECATAATHQSEAECERKKSLSKHVEISTSVMISSQRMVIVHVGGVDERQTFVAHRDLLVLHSRFFQELLSEKPEEETTEYTIKMKSIKEEEATENTQSATDPLTDLVDAYWEVMKKGQALLPSIKIDSDEESEAEEKLPVPQVQSQNQIHQNETTQSITIPDIRPVQFANFFSWLYTGTLISPLSNLITEGCMDDTFEMLYLTGVKLLAPSFQNHIMDSLCECEAEKVESLVNPDTVGDLWKLSADLREGNRKTSKLLGFLAACLAAASVFEKFAEQGERWKKLYRDNPDLMLAVLQATSSKWKESKPWDEENRKDFMVEERSLEEKWQELILARRTEKDVEVAAEKGDVRARLELACLRRGGVGGDGEDEKDE